MHDRFPPSDPLDNHLIRRETLPSQHEGALRAYYWSIDRVMKLPDGEDAVSGILVGLLEDHYEVDYTQAKQLLDRSLVDLPLASTFHDDDMRQEYQEALLLFPLLELGSFVDESYDPAASIEWYTQVGAAILERTNYAHSDDCVQHNKRGCADNVRCPWRVVADVLTKQAADPNLTSIEYMLEPERQIEMVMAKLTAARRDGLNRVDGHGIDDIVGFYQELTKTLLSHIADTPQ